MIELAFELGKSFPMSVLSKRVRGLRQHWQERMKMCGKYEMPRGHLSERGGWRQDVHSSSVGWPCTCSRKSLNRQKGSSFLPAPSTLFSSCSPPSLCLPCIYHPRLRCFCGREQFCFWEATVFKHSTDVSFNSLSLNGNPQRNQSENRLQQAQTPSSYVASVWACHLG